jgi:hypothetical protein
MPRKYPIVKPHRSPDPDPWIERRELEGPGWFRGTDSSGKTAWVPENWAEIEGDYCVMKRDYNSVELSVEVGYLLTDESGESGWARAKTGTGEGVIWIG